MLYAQFCNDIMLALNSHVPFNNTERGKTLVYYIKTQFYLFGSFYSVLHISGRVFFHHNNISALYLIRQVCWQCAFWFFFKWKYFFIFLILKNIFTEHTILVEVFSFFNTSALFSLQYFKYDSSLSYGFHF